RGLASLQEKQTLDQRIYKMPGSRIALIKGIAKYDAEARVRVRRHRRSVRSRPPQLRPANVRGGASAADDPRHANFVSPTQPQHRNPWLQEDLQAIIKIARHSMRISHARLDAW